MTGPEQKTEAPKQARQPEAPDSANSQLQDGWGRLSEQLHAEMHSIETRAIKLGSALTVDAAELYAQVFPPEKSYKLYRTSDPAESIRPADVRQGSANDCFFMGALAAVAATKPSLIKDSIAQNKEGSYTVTFAGARNAPIHVPPLTEHELSDYAKSSPDGVWPAVMEKAFGIYLSEHPDEKNKILGRANKGFMQDASNWLDNHIFDSFKDPQQLANSGDTTAAMKLLTGNAPGGLPLKDGHSVEGARSLLESSFKDSQHLPTVAAASPDNATTQALGLHPNHAYTVLNYENGMVTLRDPYGTTIANESGKTMASTDGVFQMKVEDFARAFDEVYAGRYESFMGGGEIFIGRPKFSMFGNTKKK
jgi:hypothetical protein